MFGRYRIVRALGEGGMGLVYEAEHPGLGKRVALKTLRPSFADNAEVVARFVREGMAAARIQHPNVVDVTDVGTERGLPYLVMEMLDAVVAHRLAAQREHLGPIEAHAHQQVVPADLGLFEDDVAVRAAADEHRPRADHHPGVGRIEPVALPQHRGARGRRSR